MIRKRFLWIFCVFLLFSVTIISWKPSTNTNISANTKMIASAKEVFNQYVNTIYQTAKLEQAGLDISVFQKAFIGYINLKLDHKLPQNSSVITVVDFSKPSRQKRMWIIDVLSKQLLLNTWVAHGQGSGDDIATQFSDNNDSHQSSLGFYLTDDVYMGKHGRSLRLDGLDEGFNAKARARAIVVHAADYVCQNSIDKLGRLGRSFGCPAVSPEVRDQVIDDIKGKTVLFINGNNSNYTSKYLDENSLENFADTSAYQIAATR
ncbi:MAG: hypothetical protein JWR67_3792 [Mucilaginibacter sp.]|nr:hypothetical protein [Mucilaginibacter sp.]